MSLVVVGSVAFDDLETPSGVRENLLGGSASFFSLCASHFHPIQVVAVVGEDFSSDHQASLSVRGIDLSGLERQEGRSFHWKGSYGQDLGDAQTLDTQLNVFATFRPQLPRAHREAAYLFLGNIDPTLQLQVLSQMDRRPDWVALDTMNFWIDGSRPALLEVLKQVDILLVNEAECRALSGERNLLQAFPRIRALGPRILVVKRGEHGAMLLWEGGVFALPAFPLDTVVDPTGAGDTFAGGFLGHLAHTGRMDAAALKRALVSGTVMASFTVEGFGLERLQTVTDREMAERTHAFFSMTSTDGL